jgi:hypothetical protein
MAMNGHIGSGMRRLAQHAAHRSMWTRSVNSAACGGVSMAFMAPDDGPRSKAVTPKTAPVPPNQGGFHKKLN